MPGGMDWGELDHYATSSSKHSHVDSLIWIIHINWKRSGLAKIIGAKTVIATFSSSLNDYTAWITGTPSPWAVTQGQYWFQFVTDYFSFQMMASWSFVVKSENISDITVAKVQKEDERRISWVWRVDLLWCLVLLHLRTMTRVSSFLAASYSGVLDRSISSRLWNLLAVGVDYYVNWRWAGAANDAFRERFGNDFPSVEVSVPINRLITSQIIRKWSRLLFEEWSMRCFFQ